MDEQPRRIDLTGGAFDGTTDSAGRGSAWAEVDETFFRIVQEVFPRPFCFGAAVLLASNDPLMTDGPVQVTPSEQDSGYARLSHQEKLERLNEEIDRELALRRAMRRHPSGRRRF